MGEYNQIQEKSFEEMIAADRQGWRNEILNAEPFPIKGNGVVEVEARLFHIEQGLDDSEEEVKRIQEADTDNPWKYEVQKPQKKALEQWWAVLQPPVLAYLGDDNDQQFH